MKRKNLEEILQKRFIENVDRHPGLSWLEVTEQISEKEWDTLIKMEDAGGEPDLFIDNEGGLVFVDSFKESPDDRRSVCYDEKARQSRKKNPPEKSAWGMAGDLGAKLVDEKTYRMIQSYGNFDEKGQIWLATDEDFRQTGDALFANLRHGRVFVYYNGAGSYYKTRGFRCMVKIN